MRRTNSGKKKKDDLFLRLTAVQLAAAILLFFLLFLLVRKDDVLAMQIKNELETLLEQDWDLAGWWQAGTSSVFSGDGQEDLLVPVLADQTRGANAAAVTLTAVAARTKEPDLPLLTESFYGDDAPVMPVNGTVTSEYGDRIHPITGEESFHSGRDIAAAEGTDIFAVFDGVVLATGVGELSGNYVKIDHGGGLVALYCHCSDVFVDQGDAVRKGDIIAAVGETGAATGPHLHFEIRQNGELVDPAGLLEQATRVR